MIQHTLVVAWIGMALPAQGPGIDLRGRVFGEVRDLGGEPWADAEVVLVSRPLPQNPDVGEEDRVVATTDAAGRFRVEVLRGRPYTVWAWGKAEAAGRRVSQVVERVFVQCPVMLQETGRRKQQVARLAGPEGWSAYAPFEIRVVDETGNRQVTWLTVAKDGPATLPPLVGPGAWIEVFGKGPSGRYPITRVRLDARDPSAEITIALPERERVVCWACDFVSGKPCADATVFRRLGEALHPAGMTDAQGKLQLDVAKPEAADSGTLVLAAGQAFGICGRVGQAGEQPARALLPEGAAASDLFVNLRVGVALHGRVVGTGGAPLAGLQWCCAGSATNTFSKSGGRWLEPRVQAMFHAVLRFMPYAVHDTVAEGSIRARDHMCRSTLNC